VVVALVELYLGAQPQPKEAILFFQPLHLQAVVLVVLGKGVLLFLRVVMAVLAVAVQEH
jgi:hypothetical protein